jgi:hypothetical protein
MFGTDLGQEYEIAAKLGVSAEDAYIMKDSGCSGALNLSRSWGWCT